MSTQLNAYLNFRGNAREAMEFYQTVLGGELTASTFGEFQMTQDPAEQDQIMHSQLISPSGLVLMGSDTPSYMDYTPGSNFSVSLSGEDEAELRGYWDKLAVDATISAPIGKAPWGDVFGALTDKFGISWLVNILGPSAGQ